MLRAPLTATFGFNKEGDMSSQEQWQLAGIAPESYERYLVPGIFRPWAEDLIEQIALQPGECVLDVACGTGIVARLAAQRVGATGSVTGLDLNPGMIVTARALTSSTSVPIMWREGAADALPFAEASFDVVFCQQGLQFFPDRLAALREMHRILTRGGRLVLSVWRALPHNPYVVVLAEAVARHVSPEAGASMRAPCAFGDIEALRTSIREGGFRESRIRIAVRLLRMQRVEEFILGQLAATPLAGAVAALAVSAREALLSDISDALRAYRDDEGVAVPLEAHVVVAQA